MQKVRQNKSAFAALTVYFLDNFALAIVYPIFTPLLFGQHNNFLGAITSGRFVYLGILIAAFPLMQLFGSPIIGGFSDRIGRKRAFYLTLVGEALGFALSAVAVQMSNYSLLLFSRLWTGFFAGNLTVCLAVFADLNTTLKKRTQSFGRLMMVGGLSFIIAVIIGGFLSNPRIYDRFNPTLPFWFTVLLAMINLGIIYFLFEETFHKSRCHPFKNLYRICTCQDYRNLRWLYMVYFFLMLAWIPCLQFLSPLLFLDYDARPLQITGIFVIIGFVWSISSGWINHWLSHTQKPMSILRPALLVLGLCFVLTGFPYRLWTIAIVMSIVTAAAALCWIRALALISVEGSRTFQGKVLGLNQSFGALAMIIGPMLGSYFGSLDIHYIYYTSAIACLIAIIILPKKVKSHIS